MSIVTDLKQTLANRRPKPTGIEGIYAKFPSNKGFKQLMATQKEVAKIADLPEKEDFDGEPPKLMIDLVLLGFEHVFCTQDGRKFENVSEEQIREFGFIQCTEFIVEIGAALERAAGKLTALSGTEEPSSNAT